jgi:carbamate kinase
MREMKNHPRFREMPVACVLTHVYVEKNTFEPDEYTKGVGPWIPNTEQAREELKRRGIRFRIGPDQGDIRRVVPSPRPYAIEEFSLIRRLIQSGAITICCGGGGIPVFDPYREAGQGDGSGDRFQQSEVVIDKDLASALLASKLSDSLDGAEIDLVILMEAKGLYKDASCRPEDFIPGMNLDELEVFLASSRLDQGSILPKLEAIRMFLRAGGKNAFLGPLDSFEKMFNGAQSVGTRFTQAPQLNLYP